MKKFLQQIWAYKYLEIIFAVLLFVVLDTGVLIINFYTSYEIANDAHAIQVANRQTTLSQKLFHGLYQVRQDALNPEKNYLKTADDISETYKAFDEILDAFIYGGELIGVGQGNDALLKDDTYRAKNSEKLKEIEELWQAYRIQVKSVAYASYGQLSREEVIAEADEAIAFAREHNDKLMGLLIDVSQAMEEIANQKAERLRLIQTVGISLAVINFFLILFHFIRKLNHSDRELDKARRETTEILENVTEGLFLLDNKLSIGSQYSASLSDIFNREQLAGLNFIDVLRPLVTEKMLGITKDFIEIMFSSRVSQELVTGLNPLREVEVNLPDGNGRFMTRYLAFEFSRVSEANQLVNLLVTVTDITDKVKLLHEIKKAEEKSLHDIDMLLQIIHLDGHLLMGYFSGLENELSIVNEILKNPAKSQPQYMEKVLRISRVIHTLKGECASLDLAFIEKKLHEYEDAISPLKSNQKLTGSDFIPLVIRLNQLMNDVNLVKDLVVKINSGGSDKTNDAARGKQNGSVSDLKSSGHNLSIVESWRPQFEQLVSQAAKDQNKSVKLVLECSKTLRLSTPLKDSIKNIVIQCLRNAVAHGIEMPSRRASLNKSLTGTIVVKIEQTDNMVSVRVRDDGRGIDVDAIREKAITMGMVEREQLTQWKPQQIISLIFKPDFSTYGSGNAAADKHAGRGVGLDVVKDIVDSQNGKVGVSFKVNEYTEFRFNFETVRKMTAIA